MHGIYADNEDGTTTTLGRSSIDALGARTYTLPANVKRLRITCSDSSYTSARIYEIQPAN